MKDHDYNPILRIQQYQKLNRLEDFRAFDYIRSLLSFSSVQNEGIRFRIHSEISQIFKWIFPILYEEKEKEITKMNLLVPIQKLCPEHSQSSTVQAQWVEQTKYRIVENFQFFYYKMDDWWFSRLKTISFDMSGAYENRLDSYNVQSMCR